MTERTPGQMVNFHIAPSSSDESIKPPILNGKILRVYEDGWIDIEVRISFRETKTYMVRGEWIK